MGTRKINDSLDALVVALCADFERRDRAIAGGTLAHRVEMEYRYYNSNIYTAACEVVGAPNALLYINDIGEHRGYAHSEVERISDTTYKRQKSAVFGNIARRLHLAE
jgi:hypothetical protein